MRTRDYDRVFAIGDIHGWHKPLVNLISALSLGPNDRIITLGDYVDRGPDNPKVLDTVISLWNQGLLIPIRGNHDQGMMDAALSQEHLMSWRNMLQGDTTLRTYGLKRDTLSEFRQKVPKDHFLFLRQACRNWLELDEFICVHGGVECRLEMEDQPLYTLHWKRFHEHVYPHISDKVMVCGHSAVGKLPKVDKLGQAVCVDTGMGVSDEGWLTALDLNSGQFVQANRKGHIRTGELEWPIPGY